VKIIEKKVEELIPYVNNPRNNEAAVDFVASSIKEFGFKNPIIIDKENVIVAGHTRLAAAKKLGLESVPCIMADDLSEQQIKAFRLADNKTAELATWDLEKLEIELEGIDDLEMTDFGFEELEDSGDVVEVIEDEVPDVPEKPKSKLGDIFKLGRHRLICGDSTDPKTLEILMGGVEAELLFPDPPYQLKAQGGGILKHANSMKQIIENKVDSFDPSTLQMISKTNIFCHNKMLIKDYIELAERNGMPYDLTFYKKKNTVPNYKGHMMTDVEYIAIIGNQDPNKGLEKEMYSKCFIGQKDSDNELSYSKPVALCAKYIQLYSKQFVVDLFGGSGSTLIACEQLGRTCFMCELDPKYVDVIIERWEKFTGGKAERV
jgi:site-specific DNA-methyltransferase (adenine-specific)